MSDLDKPFGEISAPFNMAINTLERLGEILREIKQVSFFQTGESQRTKVFLVKQFFYQAVPLLKDNIVSQYQRKILDLTPKEVKVVKKYTNELIKSKPVWDSALENQLDEIIIEIQQELQKEKYFMPPRKDPARAATEF